MGFELREALRRICVEIGWSYAVFWRAIGSPNPKHLVWEDGHWYGKKQLSLSDDSNSHSNCLPEFQTQGEGIIDELVCKTMVPEVHVMGCGMVGQATSVGNHQWILRDVDNDREPILLHFEELKKQFMSGIQTIVIIPVLPHGAVQFGSTMRVMENSLFVNHVRTTFMQFLCKPGSSYGVAQKLLGQNNLEHGICSATFDYPFRGECSNIDKSLSMRCNNQLVISSASKSLSQFSSSLSTRCHENLSKDDSERLSTKKVVTNVSLPLVDSCLPMIRPDGNSLFHLNNRLDSGLVEAKLISHKDVIPSAIEVSLATGSLSFMEEKLLSLSGNITQEPANITKTSVRDMYGEADPYSLHPKFAALECTNDHDRIISAAAPIKENVQSSCCKTSNAYSQSMPHNIDAENGNQSSHLNSSSMNQSRGMPCSGNRKQKNYLPLSCDLPSGSSYGFVQGYRSSNSSAVGGNLGLESTNCYIHNSLNIEKGPSLGVEKDSNFTNLPNEKYLSFLPLTTPGNDLFEVLGLYGSLDSSMAINPQTSLDVTSCNAELNLPPILYSVINNDLSCSEVFSESNTDQLLDAVISKISPGTRHNIDGSPSCKTSPSKVSCSALYCDSPSNDRSASSGKKHGEYISPSMLTSNSEAVASTSLRSADSIDETERSGCYESQISLWLESSQNKKSDKLLDLHIKRFDETSKVNRKRPRPGETPRPRPKDRQLIMDRVKELREIVPNGAKCSIDALLEKTIKHMIFLQSVAKHADKMRDSREPKIISKDGRVLLKDGFEGGATWAFEFGSQPMACPIIVEDLNPPREMLVEMLCEEHGFFLEIADLIRGLGLTILKGVMEARKDKIWARFVVEANRDVTRMEIFLSLVRSLEPTIGGGTSRHSTNNSNIPLKMVDSACVPVTGASDAL